MWNQNCSRKERKTEGPKTAPGKCGAQFFFRRTYEELLKANIENKNHYK